MGGRRDQLPQVPTAQGSGDSSSPPGCHLLAGTFEQMIDPWIFTCKANSSCQSCGGHVRCHRRKGRHGSVSYATLTSSFVIMVIFPGDAEAAEGPQLPSPLPVLPVALPFLLPALLSLSCVFLSMLLPARAPASPSAAAGGKKRGREGKLPGGALGHIRAAIPSGMPAWLPLLVSSPEARKAAPRQGRRGSPGSSGEVGTMNRVGAAGRSRRKLGGRLSRRLLERSTHPLQAA